MFYSKFLPRIYFTWSLVQYCSLSGCRFRTMNEFLFLMGLTCQEPGYSGSFDIAATAGGGSRPVNWPSWIVGINVNLYLQKPIQTLCIWKTMIGQRALNLDSMGKANGHLPTYWGRRLNTQKLAPQPPQSIAV